MNSIQVFTLLLFYYICIIYKCEGYQSGGWSTEEEADYYCIKQIIVYGETKYSCSQKPADKFSSIEEARSSCVRYYQVRNSPRWNCA